MTDDLRDRAEAVLCDLDRIEVRHLHTADGCAEHREAQIAALVRAFEEQRREGAREALERAAARLDRIAKLADRSSKDASHDERSFNAARWVAYDDAASIVRDCVGAADAPEWVRFEATAAPGGGEVARMYRLDGDVVHIAAPPPPAPGQDAPAPGPEPWREVTDGHGNVWSRCAPDCGLHVVRPGKVQCDHDRCAEPAPGPDALLDANTPDSVVDAELRGMGLDPDALREKGAAFSRSAMKRRAVQRGVDPITMMKRLGDTGPGPERCEVCDWPLAESRDKGCVPGDCSYRPAEGTEECRRIDARRAELRKRTAPGPDARGVCDYCTGRGTVPDFRGTLPIDDEKPCPSCTRSEPEEWGWYRDGGTVSDGHATREAAIREAVVGCEVERFLVGRMVDVDQATLVSTEDLLDDVTLYDVAKIDVEAIVERAEELYGEAIEDGCVFVSGPYSAAQNAYAEWAEEYLRVVALPGAQEALAVWARDYLSPDPSRTCRGDLEPPPSAEEIAAAKASAAPSCTAPAGEVKP